MKNIKITIIGVIFAALFIVSAPNAKTHSKQAQPSFKISQYSGNFLATNLALSNLDFKNSAKFLTMLYKSDRKNLLVIERLFISHLINGNFKAASLFAERYKKLQTSEDKPHYLLTDFLMLDALKANDYEKAKSLIVSNGGFGVSDLSFNATTAWVNYAQGNIAASVDSLNKIKDIGFLTIYYLINSAILAELQGKQTDADGFYSQALAMGGSKLDLIDAYGRFLERAGRGKQALALYDDFESRAGSNRLIEQARKRLEAGIKPKPFISNAKAAIAYNYFQIAKMYNGSLRYGDATQYARLAQYLAPENEYIIQILAQNYQSIGRLLDANIELQKINKKSPFYKNAQINIAKNMFENGQSDLALKKMNGLLENGKIEDDVYLAYANMLLQNENYTSAIKFYSQLIKNRKLLTINDADLFYRRGIAYHLSDNWDKAELDFKQAIKLFPTHALALNYLGYSWVDRGVNLEQGLKMIKTALEVDPENSYIIDSLGWAYYKLGKYELSKIQLERAAEINPSNADISDHLGDVYWKLGRKLEAEFKWQQATIFKSDEINYGDLAFKRKYGLDALLKKNNPDLIINNEPVTVKPTGVKNHVVVLQGESLWDISKRLYGDGEFYLEIYKLNKDKIHSPNLIKTGQSLLLPTGLKIKQGF